MNEKKKKKKTTGILTGKIFLKITFVGAEYIAIAKLKKKDSL